MISFKLFLEGKAENRAYSLVRAKFNQPLTLQNSVLFPVSHGQEVVTDDQSVNKMKDLMQKGTTVWHEGNQAEHIVVDFLQKNQLENLPLLSWEPEEHGKKINSQGSLLNDIFGGDTKSMLYMIYSHPDVANKMAKGGHQIKNNHKKGTSQIKWNSTSSYIPTILELLIKSSSGDQQAWASKSAQASPENIRKLLSQTPHLSVMLDMEATPQNMHKFLSLGQNLAYNIFYVKGRTNTNQLANLESEVQIQRDTHLLELMKNQGGIFFAGSYHVVNVRKILK
jgi:hypothetical protein